jgi:hypothetical protein
MLGPKIQANKKAREDRGLLVWRHMGREEESLGRKGS